MLKITYIPTISEGFAARLKENALAIDPASEVRAERPAPQGVVEWALPAIIAFIVGGVSAAVLQEAGKDIYRGLKKLVADAYEEASKSPYEWQSGRREPSLDASAARPGAAGGQRPPAGEILSPALKVTLEIDEWNGRLTFVYANALSAAQVDEAYAAMAPTTQAILAYCDWLSAQLQSKRRHPELYQGSMPDSIWDEQFQIEVHEASALLHAVFLFDAEARVWGRVH